MIQRIGFHLFGIMWLVASFLAARRSDTLMVWAIIGSILALIGTTIIIGGELIYRLDKWLNRLEQSQAVVIRQKGKQ